MDVMVFWFVLMVAMSFQTVPEGLKFVPVPMNWMKAKNYCRTFFNGSLSCLSLRNVEDIFNHQRDDYNFWIGTYTTLSSWFLKKENVSGFTLIRKYDNIIDKTTCQLLCHDTYFAIKNENCHCFTKSRLPISSNIRTVYEAPHQTEIRRQFSCRYKFCPVNNNTLAYIEDEVKSKYNECGYNNIDYMTACGWNNATPDDRCISYDEYIENIYGTATENVNVDCRLLNITKDCTGNGTCTNFDIIASYVDYYESGIGFKSVKSNDVLPIMKCFKGVFTDSGNGTYKMEFHGTTDCNGQEKQLFFCDDTKTGPDICSLDGFELSERPPPASTTEYENTESETTSTKSMTSSPLRNQGGSAGVAAGISVGLGLVFMTVAVIVILILWKRYKRPGKHPKDQQFNDIRTTTNPSYESPPLDQLGSEYDVIKEPGEYQTTERNEYTYIDSNFNRNALGHEHDRIQPNIIPNKGNPNAYLDLVPHTSTQGSMFRVDPCYELQNVPADDSESNSTSVNNEVNIYSLAVNTDEKTKSPTVADYEVPRTSKGIDIGQNSKSEVDYISSAEGDYDHLHDKLIRKQQINTNTHNLYAHTNPNFVDDKHTTYDTTVGKPPGQHETGYNTTSGVSDGVATYETTFGNHGNVINDVTGSEL